MVVVLQTDLFCKETRIINKLGLNHPLPQSASTRIGDFDRFMYILRYKKTTLYSPDSSLRISNAVTGLSPTDIKTSMPCWHRFHILQKKTIPDKISKPGWTYSKLFGITNPGVLIMTQHQNFYWKFVKNITYISSSWEPNPCGTMNIVVKKTPLLRCRETHSCMGY